jgi:enolase
MGGRHTEKEYPESNISFQEMMFLPLCMNNYEEAQMITVSLQTRLKEIIENEEGARVMGIGLEGGLAPYIDKAAEDTIPEERMWRVAVQAIKDIGYKPGEEIAIAFDPAVSELSNAYREEFNQEDSIGMYYFWRGEEKVLMSRDQLLELYKKIIMTIPIVSLEDAFSEDDYEGWRLLLEELGDKIFVIGDDLVTTKDSTIEECADKKLINTALIKANQIGTLSETILAILVALGKGLEVVVSHRSKSPNDDMEAQIALAANALGLKCGGGSNTERLFKYGAVTKIMNDMAKATVQTAEGNTSSKIDEVIDDLIITDIIAYEEPTNAGIPTVGVEVYAGIKGNDKFRKVIKFSGSTPLGTSAGMDEAIHLIDSTIERSSVTDSYPEFFLERPDKTFTFKKEISENEVLNKKNTELTELWKTAHRYEGKGCKNAVSSVLNVIKGEFVGKKVSDLLGIAEIDKKLLLLEKECAIKREKISSDTPEDELIKTMQRKGNLGMNAILSMSLALARLVSHVQGKDLWQVLREMMKETTAKTITANGGLDLLSGTIPNEKLEKIKGNNGGSWEQLEKELTLEELIQGLQKVNERATTEDTKLYQLIREHMPIYSVG